jgi:hypothetical protein
MEAKMNVSGMSSMGGMSPAQMQQMQQKMFAKADADQSGGISLQEFTNTDQAAKSDASGRANGMDASKMFSKLDADGDGQLTQTEMKPPQDGRGKLSPEMMSAMLGMQGAGGPAGAGSAGGSAEGDMLLQLFAQKEDDTSQTTQTTSSDETAASTEQDLISQLLDMMDQSAAARKENQQQAANKPSSSSESGQGLYRHLQDAANANTNTQSAARVAVSA